MGASAGGLVAGLFASGMSPEVMGKTVVEFRRADFWDPVGFGGLLRGKKFEVGGRRCCFCTSVPYKSLLFEDLARR